MCEYVILERGREMEGGREESGREREGGREGGREGRGRERKRETQIHTHRVLLFYVYLIGYSCHSQS